jgi:hypothetical protein
VTELDPWADEREPDAVEEEPPWRLALLVGAAVIPLGWVLPPGIAGVLWLLAPAAVGALAGGDAFLGGAAVGLPAALVLVVVAVVDLGPVGVLFALGAALYVFVSGLLGSAGEVALRSWFDRSSDNPEVRARARRGMIIVAVAVLFFGGPMAINGISDQRADDRANALQRRLLKITKASVPFDAFAFASAPTNPISDAVPEVQIIATGVGANMQAEAHWGWSSRCVWVQVNDLRVTSRIVKDPCGPLVGR